jgi:hypothetical protein
MIGDRTDRWSFGLSLGIHGLSLLLCVGLPWWLFWDPPVESAEDEPGLVLLEPVPTTLEAAPAGLPALPPLTGQTGAPDSGTPLPPESTTPLQLRLFNEAEQAKRAAEGEADQGDGIAIDLPSLAEDPAFAGESAIASAQTKDRAVDRKQRNEQEANGFLQFRLQRHYRQHWHAIYGDRLANRPLYLWIEHDRSRVISARFAAESTTGIPSLDRQIITWLVEANEIDLTDLSGSASPLLMTITLGDRGRR